MPLTPSDYDSFRMHKGDKDDKSYRKNVASHNYNTRRQLPGSPENKASEKKMSIAKKMSTNGMKVSQDNKPSKGANN